MPLTKPRTLNYKSPLKAQRAIFTQPPPGEAPQFVPIDITWGDYSTNAVSLNLQNNSELAFSRIVAMAVDNSDCGADVRFIFLDTDTSITIPAYTPYCIVPVFTNSREVVVQTALNGQTVVATDTTRFQIHNALPPPIAVPVSEEQSTAAVGAISSATASTDIIANTVNGTLEAANLNLAVNAANSGSGTWTLQDGAGTTIATGAYAFSSGDKFNITLFQLTELRVRFRQGIKLLLTQTAVLGATINVNLYYRMP